MHSVQTTIRPNCHKVLGLSCSKIKWWTIYANLPRNPIVRLPYRGIAFSTLVLSLHVNHRYILGQKLKCTFLIYVRHVIMKSLVCTFSPDHITFAVFPCLLVITCADSAETNVFASSSSSYILRIRAFLPKVYVSYLNFLDSIFSMVSCWYIFYTVFYKTVERNSYFC